jgi:hypothetical protein
LLIFGILLLVAAVLSFALAALNFYAYRHVMDGSPELFDRMHQRAVLFLVLGAVLALSGTVCMIVRAKH